MSKQTTIDLAALSPKKKSEEGFEFELLHPVTNEGVGVFITVAGSESDRFRNYVRKQGNEKLRTRFQNQRKGKDAVAPTIEGVEEETIGLLAECTLSWRTGDDPVVKHDGKPLECNLANAAFIYRELRWIRDQADEAIGDLGNFIGS